MAKVIATERGFYGRELRDPGDVFEADGKASWFIPFKGDATPAPAPEPAGDAPDLASMTVKELRAYAKDHDIPLAASVTNKAEIISAIQEGSGQAPTAEPFADAPEPVRVTNEVNDALGTTHPDWVTPNGDI